MKSLITWGLIILLVLAAGVFLLGGREVPVMGRIPTVGEVTAKVPFIGTAEEKAAEKAPEKAAEPVKEAAPMEKVTKPEGEDFVAKAFEALSTSPAGDIARREVEPVSGWKMPAWFASLLFSVTVIALLVVLQVGLISKTAGGATKQVVDTGKAVETQIKRAPILKWGGVLCIFAGAVILGIVAYMEGVEGWKKLLYTGILPALIVAAILELFGRAGESTSDFLAGLLSENLVETIERVLGGAWNVLRTFLTGYFGISWVIASVVDSSKIEVVSASFAGTSLQPIGTAINLVALGTKAADLLQINEYVTGVWSLVLAAWGLNFLLKRLEEKKRGEVMRRVPVSVEEH